MALKTWAALLASVAIASVSLTATADAAPKKKVRVYNAASRAYNGPVRAYNGPANYSYMADSRTRVYVTRRSWLDAGTEVLPGERKFNDYAIPPGYSYGGLIDRNYYPRHPLSDNYDLGGGPLAFPLY